MDIDDFDSEGLLISRERVSNEYSHINANMVLLESIRFLFDGITVPKKRYKLSVSFYSIIDYRYFATATNNDEEFPFKKNMLVISRHGKIAVLTNNGSTTSRFHVNDLVLFVADIFGKHKFKIENIAISCVNKSIKKSVTLYSNKLYHVSYMNPSIETNAVATITRHWRSYQDKKIKIFKYEHMKNLHQVCNEIVCLPPGGYQGNFATFPGGQSFLECYKTFMAR